ncbi:MBL fold metallo-hydrolase [Sandaracinus amylolyticus]|uniref:MBL fold metallo-hydrolase n=1 Tax=Sandaracinus amylolyticus TaxID=927083 RepID=UPI001F4655EF|nr:MBL fold metallo-hydrolase [Sandaracinus amylolyticus]
MRIHHLNCVSSCPLGGWIFDGRTESIVRRGRFVCHCLLIEAGRELVLVDTGFGLRDVADPESRLSKLFLALLAPDFRDELTAIRQVERLGFEPRDVRHIVMTHLDFDHAGGLDDFPWATVHLLESERESAMAQRTWLDRQRYRPQQWSTSGSWRTYRASAGERWHGFERVLALDGVPDDVVMVPLIGHTLGHAGVAVRRGEGWLMQAGDAYFFHAEMDPKRPRCPPGLRAYQWMMEKDRRARLANQRRLRDLVARDEGVEITCSHDVREFERLSGRSAAVPRHAMRPPPHAPRGVEIAR